MPTRPAMAVRAAATAAALLLGGRVAARNQGYQDSRPWLPREPVAGAVPADALVAEEDLPQAFDWRSVNGRNYATSDWNQHIPIYCGSCWIHGTVSALNDRIKIMRKAQWPDVRLGRQTIMDCVPDPTNLSKPPPGCDGGDAWMIHQYLSEHKVPDETCMPYQAKNMACDASHNCRNCFPDGSETGKCWAIKHYTGYGVKTYGNLSGETAMMKEIYARGPIACSFATDERFMFQYSEVALQNEGVYVSNKTFTMDDMDHVMEVAGWGETPSGRKYWVIRNSWGTFWGDAGWLKLLRGANDSLVEAQCDWAVPTWDELDDELLGKVLGSYASGVHPVGEIAQVLASQEEPPSQGVAPSPALLVPCLLAALAGALAVLAVAAACGAAPRDALRQAPLLG